MARILIVEDEKNAREALGEVFSAQHEVRLAEDVAEARAVLAGESVDLVLTDVVLPGEEDGLDLLGHVTRNLVGVPVIVMTAYGSVEKAVRAMRDGAHDFLEKPLDLARLRNLVASALRAPRPGAGQRGLPRAARARRRAARIRRRARRPSARSSGGWGRPPRRTPRS